MIFESFKSLRESNPHSPAFLIAAGDRALPISWRTFTDDIDAVVHIIRKFAYGSTIAILGENSYEWMVAHAAILFSGAIALPLDTALSAPEIAERLKFAKASFLMYSSLYEETAHKVARLCPGLGTGGLGSHKTEKYLSAARKAIAENSDSIWSLSKVDDQHVSMLVFTSGTTAEPRAVELTIAGIEGFSEWGVKCLPMSKGDHSLMLLPLYHIFGICSAYLMLTQGVAIGVCPDFRRIYDAVKRFSADFLFLVPALAEILAQKIRQKGNNAETVFGRPIRWILTGGAALARRTYENLSELGVRMMTAYGLTETSASFAMMPYSEPPSFGAQGKVAELEGVEAKVSETGELLIKGPFVMKGYYKMPERTAKVIDQDGFFHTGDIGRIDERGYVYITGRASRTIVLSSGKKVAPEEMEEKLVSLPGILEAVVSGEGESREIRAEVFSHLSQSTVERMIGEMNLTLPVYKRIKTIILRTSPFPRTSSGKIQCRSVV